MRKIFPTLAVLAAIVLGTHYLELSRVSPQSSASSSTSAPASNSIASAFAEHRSGIEVAGQGTVARVLADDREGSPHQRFILMLPSGQTLLIAHNIVLAERIPSLKRGDAVQFKGEYEWNSQGGIVHWTHEDPGGRHEAGWLKHDGRTYQ